MRKRAQGPDMGRDIQWSKVLLQVTTESQALCRASSVSQKQLQHPIDLNSIIKCKSGLHTTSRVYRRITVPCALRKAISSIWHCWRFFALAPSTAPILGSLVSLPKALLFGASSETSILKNTSLQQILFSRSILIMALFLFIIYIIYTHNECLSTSCWFLGLKKAAGADLCACAECSRLPSLCRAQPDGAGAPAPDQQLPCWPPLCSCPFMPAIPSAKTRSRHPASHGSHSVWGIPSRASG